MCGVWQIANEFRQTAEDAWRRVHWLFMVEDDWSLCNNVDDICVYSQHSSSLGKILKLEVSDQLASRCFEAEARTARTPLHGRSEM